MKKTTKPGLRDVARLAQVSLATASRTFSNPDLVSETVRNRVEEASRELNYISNRSARKLSKKQSETFGIIVPSVSNPLFALTIDGFRSALEENGLGMMINSAERNPSREYAQVRTFLEHGVDGIATLMPTHDPDLAGLVEYAGVPFIYLSPPVDAKKTPTLGYDNIGAMKEMTKAVLSRGHREIAILSGPRSSTPIIAERIDAITNTLEDAGVPVNPKLVVESDHTAAEARRGAREVIERSDQITAVICTGDQHALAIAMEAHRKGISVPDDLCVTGCNNLSWSLLCQPQISTIDLPYREIGENAAKYLISAVSGDPIQITPQLPYKIIIRESLSERR